MSEKISTDSLNSSSLTSSSEGYKMCMLSLFSFAHTTVAIFLYSNSFSKEWNLCIEHFYALPESLQTDQNESK